MLLRLLVLERGRVLRRQLLLLCRVLGVMGNIEGRLLHRILMGRDLLVVPCVHSSLNLREV